MPTIRLVMEIQVPKLNDAHVAHYVSSEIETMIKNMKRHEWIYTASYIVTNHTKIKGRTRR